MVKLVIGGRLKRLLQPKEKEQQSVPSIKSSPSLSKPLQKLDDSEPEITKQNAPVAMNLNALKKAQPFKMKLETEDNILDVSCPVYEIPIEKEIVKQVIDSDACSFDISPKLKKQIKQEKIETPVEDEDLEEEVIDEDIEEINEVEDDSEEEIIKPISRSSLSSEQKNIIVQNFSIASRIKHNAKND